MSRQRRRENQANSEKSLTQHSRIPHYLSILKVSVLRQGKMANRNVPSKTVLLSLFLIYVYQLQGVWSRMDGEPAIGWEVQWQTQKILARRIWHYVSEPTIGWETSWYYTNMSTIVQNMYLRMAPKSLKKIQKKYSKGHMHCNISS